MAEDILTVGPMLTEHDSNVQLQIGHVLFMDLVGYSTMLLDEQRQYHEQLTEIVRSTRAGSQGKRSRKSDSASCGRRHGARFF